ncbi:MAG: hypothetical protein C4527_25420 [Candidatus Omnitrophota bacterium]|jgi:hypothetical protein|nr:MAG: hypothetical protein C4527_25420 [Candidatus Omnitrophota bacterium]
MNDIPKPTKQNNRIADSHEQQWTSSSPFHGSLKVIALGTVSAIAYFYLFLLSGEELKPGAANPAYLDRFLITYAFLFFCYWRLISPLLRGRRMDPRHLWFAIAFGLLFRAVLLPSDMILSNDVYRYMWDGHMSVKGVNPYRMAPSDPRTEPHRADYWDQIDDPSIPTVHPPTFQLVFLLSELIYPANVFGMKFFLLIFDVGTIFMLLVLLDHLQRPREWCLIYSWSPLVIKEIANSGHADSVSAFLLVGCMVLITQKSFSSSSVVLALLTLTKFFGVLLLPLFHRVWRWKHFLFFFFTIILLYSPYLDFEINGWQGLITYSREWNFNAGMFDLIRDGCSVWGMESENVDPFSRLLLFSVVLVTIMWQVIVLNHRQEDVHLFHSFFIVIGTLLICSPVIHPWYLVWLAPLLVLFPNRAWLLFTGLVFLSYTYFYDRSFPNWVKPVEFGVFFVLLMWDAIFHRKKERQII